MERNAISSSFYDNRRPRIAGVRALMQGIMLGAALLLASECLAATWELLGTRTVRLIGDRDVIVVTALRGTFTHIQLRVSGNAIFMNDLEVTFSNGQKIDVPVRFLIPDGGQTRAINLPGIRRFIRTIELRYRSVPNSNGRATVEVWGRK